MLKVETQLKMRSKLKSLISSKILLPVFLILTNQSQFYLAIESFKRSLVVRLAISSTKLIRDKIAIYFLEWFIWKG